MNAETKNPWAEEQAKRAVRYDAFQKTVAAVAKLLGGRTEKQLPENAHDCTREWNNVTLTEGGLHFSLDTYKGRIRISGNWPRDCKNQIHTPSNWEKSEYSSITVSEEKAPEVIAKDIQRRFLPAYLAEYRRQVERANGATKYEQDGVAAVVRLAIVAGTQPTDYARTSKSFRHGDISVDARGASVEVKFDSLPVEKAAKLIELFRTL